MGGTEMMLLLILISAWSVIAFNWYIESTMGDNSRPRSRHKRK
jgi:hypothetical protein